MQTFRRLQMAGCWGVLLAMMTSGCAATTATRSAATSAPPRPPAAQSRPAKPTTSPPAATATTGTDRYALAPGDVVTVHFWGANNDLSQVFTVNPQGKIFVPRIGEITATGMSAKALEQLLRRRVAAISPGTNVLVILSQSRSISLFVYGQVLKPGAVPYRPGMRFSEALNAAGGPTAQAWLHNVRLAHAVKGQAGSVVDVNAHDILYRARYDRDPEVRPDDVIFVPEAFFTVNNLKELSGLILGGVGLFGVVANMLPR